MRKEYRRPDPAAMERALEQARGETGEVVLRLAWNLGLSREEIRQLTWEEVEMDAGQIRLPDRTIPLEGAAEDCLGRRAADRGFVLEGRGGVPLQAPSVSRLARQALDREPALREISLRDLRHDFIIRQLAEHDWPYVARISGMAATSMYSLFSDYMTGPGSAPAELSPEPEETRVRAILRAEGAAPEGLALWLAWDLGLEVNELIALTWDAVDWEGGALRLPDRTVSLTTPLLRRLEEERQSRAPEDDPHILLTPRSRRPYDHSRLSYAARTLFIRRGVEQWTMSRVIHAARRNQADGAVLALAAERGSLTRRDVMALLGVASVAAYERLRRLTEAGRLVRVGVKYYPAGAVVPPEEQYAAVRAFLEQNGAAYRQDLADLLRLEGRPCAAVLRRMVDEGRLVRAGQIYKLPPEVTTV